MKKLLVLILCAINQSIFGQTVITYDFLNDTISKLVNIKYGDAIQFRIINVNTFKYKVAITGRELDYNIIPPKITSFVKFPEGLDIEIKAQDDRSKDTASRQIENFIYTVEKYKASVKSLEECKSLYNNLSEILIMENQPFSAIDEGKTKIIKQFIRPDCVNPPECMILIKTEALRRQSAVKELYLLTQNLFNTIDQKSTEYSKCRTLMDQATNLNKDLENYDYQSLIEKLLVLFQKFNDKNFTYNSPITVAKTDKLIYNIKIFPIDAEKNLKDTIKFEIPISVFGGLKIDYSSGVVFNFIGKSFDQSYRLESNPLDTNFVTIKENYNRNVFLPSFGAFIHFYPRQRNDLKIAGTFGLSSEDLKNIKYHLGLSLIFGSNRRIVLSCGATGNYANILSQNYTVNQNLSKEVNLETVPTEEVFKIGGFLSFTYNLNNKN